VSAAPERCLVVAKMEANCPVPYRSAPEMMCGLSRLRQGAN